MLSTLWRLELITIESVSYTHLDVYKRQAMENVSYEPKKFISNKNNKKQEKLILRQK